MEELQNEFEKLYNNADDETYIRSMARIKSVFQDIHPYEDSNKRTSICLINSMLLARGIIPPVISRGNDSKVQLAEISSSEEEYEEMENLILEKTIEINKTFGNHINVGGEGTFDLEQSPILKSGRKKEVAKKDYERKASLGHVVTPEIMDFFNKLVQSNFEKSKDEKEDSSR